MRVQAVVLGAILLGWLGWLRLPVFREAYAAHAKALLDEQWMHTQCQDPVFAAEMSLRVGGICERAAALHGRRPWEVALEAALAPALALALALAPATYVPGWHLAHALAPPEAYVPATHWAVHAAAAPAAAWYLPGAHARHALAPMESTYVPWRHALQ